jgi:protein TonB
MPLETNQSLPAPLHWTDLQGPAHSTIPLVGGFRFILVFLAHIGIIAGGLELANRPEVQAAAEQLFVRLVELTPPPPPPAPPQVAKPLPTPRVPTPRPLPPPPVLTAATEAAPVSSFSVPPQPAAPSAPFIPAPVAAAPVPVTAARFDADYLNNPKPAYPRASRRLSEQGTVTLRVRVGADGLPLAVELRQSSGFPRLDDAALDAVRQWRFVPARQGDTPIASWATVPIAFKLES